jgi:hypothetical protein
MLPVSLDCSFLIAPPELSNFFLIIISLLRQLNIALGENHSEHATKVLFSEHVRHLAMLAILLMPFDFPTPNTFK